MWTQKCFLQLHEDLGSDPYITRKHPTDTYNNLCNTRSKRPTVVTRRTCWRKDCALFRWNETRRRMRSNRRSCGHETLTLAIISGFGCLEGKGKFLNSALSGLLKALYTLSPVQSNTISTWIHGKHSATLQLMREGCSYKWTALCIARYSFIQLS
jgi:hypothetical protein